MALWVFTNIITTIPYYYVKVEVIADCGTTGTLNATNGGYVMSLGDLNQSIDAGNSAYKPGEMSIRLKNIDDVFSTNVFNNAIVRVELRIGISYDAGTNYENFFCGFIDTETRDYKEKVTTNTEIRVYNLKAFDAMMSLRGISTAGFTTSPPANLITETSVPARHIYADLVTTGTLSTMDLASYDEVLLSALSGIPFVAGAFAPTIAIDTSALDAEVICKNGANVSNDFSDIYSVWTIPTVNLENGFASFGSGINYGDTQWRASIHSADNMLEAIRQIMESFQCYPISRLTESGGNFTYTVHFEPMGSLVTGGTIVGSLGDFYLKDGTITEWYDGLEISTVNMPLAVSNPASYGGKVRQFANRFTTAVDFSLDLYYLSKVNGRGLGLTPLSESHGFGGQMLYFRTGGNTYTAIQMKHRTYQTFYPTATTNLDLAWYGVQDSMEDLIIDNLATSMTRRADRESRKASYKTLRDPGVAAGSQLFGFRAGKDTTIDTLSFKAYNMAKSIETNKTTVDWLEET